MVILGFLVVFLIAIAELSFRAVFLPEALAPVLLISLTVIWSLSRGFQAAFPLAVALGFVFDLLSGERLGSTVVYLALSAFATGFLSKRFQLQHETAAWFSGATLAFLGSIAYPFFTSLMLRESFAASTHLEALWATALASIALSVVFYPLLVRIARYRESLMSRGFIR